MNIKQKYVSRKNISLFLIPIIVSAGIFYVFHSNRQTVADLSDNKEQQSMFSFAGADGWWQGATNETSMALFDQDEVASCFTSVEYKNGNIDDITEIKKVNDSLVGEGYIVENLGAKHMDMQTYAGKKKYILHQSAVRTPQGKAVLKGGQEFGYLQLEEGYIKIMGYCDTVEELPKTLPALEAVWLNS